MRSRKQIEPDQPVELAFTERQKTVILDHTFTDPDLMKQLESATPKGKKLIARYTLDDLE